MLPLRAAAIELAATVAAGGRVLELVDREPSIRDPAGPRRCPSFPRSSRSSASPLATPRERRRRSTGFDLRLEPGRRVALVGPSGAGKTTVTNLLLRFLDPEAGPGDARWPRRARAPPAGRPADLRARRPGRARLQLDDPREPRASPGRTRPTPSSKASLRRARLDEWVASLPDGLDTLVGEEGSQLSGGQRQRLTLARALLADAPVLVLDEPTAHLDPETAEELMRDILAAADDRSVLLITHRPEGLDLVDEVVELSPAG